MRLAFDTHFYAVDQTVKVIHLFIRTYSELCDAWFGCAELKDLEFAIRGGSIVFLSATRDSKRIFRHLLVKSSSANAEKELTNNHIS